MGFDSILTDVLVLIAIIYLGSRKQNRDNIRIKSKLSPEAYRQLTED